MNGDNLFFEQMAKSLEANKMISSLVELRVIYNNFKEIANDELANADERQEAHELTKDGFYSMIGKIARMN